MLATPRVFQELLDATFLGIAPVLLTSSVLPVHAQEGRADNRRQPIRARLVRGAESQGYWGRAIANATRPGV